MMSKPSTKTEQPEWKRATKRLCVIAFLAYAGVALFVAGFQRSLIYVPFRQNAITSADAGLLAGRVDDIAIEADDGVQLHGWLMHAAGDRERTVLFCPGNAANRTFRVEIMDLLSKTGSDVVLFDYRGYGDNQGSPSEELIAADERKIWEWLVEEQQVPPEEIVIFGRSLGGGVAVRLTSDLAEQGVSPAGLILVATFSSMSDAAKNRFGWLPVDLLLSEHYPSEDLIGECSCPIIHLHGERDGIVPHDLGEKLFARAPEQSKSGVDKHFVSLHGAGHNDIIINARHRFRVEVDQFFQRLDSAR